MKGQVIGAPSKGPRKPVNKPSTVRARTSPVVLKSAGPSAKPPSETTDEELAIAFHRIVCANLPNLTLVEDLNNLYQQMYRKNFPKIDGGILSFVVSKFSHILTVTNANGRVFVGPTNPPETTPEGIMAIHRRLKNPSSASVMSLPPVWSSSQATAPSPPISVPVFSGSSANMNTGGSASVTVQPVSPTVLSAPSRPQMNEQTLSLLSQGVRKILTTNPALGDAANLDELRDQISRGFFDMFKMPIALEGGKILVDPVTILKKGEGNLFSKLVEEPVTGRVSVKGITKVSPVAPSGKSGAMSQDPQIAEGMKKLRTALVRNLELIDNALAGYTTVADLQLCINGLGLLTDQETKFAENFQIMFPSNRST